MTATASSTGQVLREVAIGAGLVAGTANVIMQLARPEVGYGVLESRVDSGNLFRHPVKRTRTTLSYLAVVTLGGEAERVAYRRAVNRSHAQVRSTPESPVRYNAFDRDLQLWVAACLYRGFEDTYHYFGPPLDPARRATLYRESAAFGTVLQVPAERWPADRAAFERYWTAELDRVSIDAPVRDYLTRLVDLEPFALPVRRLGRSLNRFVTTGFLPPRFRDEMHLPWSAADQRRFDRLMGSIGTVTRAAPRPLREFPFNLLITDVRRRIRAGRSLV
jgi:uncharacterized protein (DUF2236 family)